MITNELQDLSWRRRRRTQLTGFAGDSIGTVGPAAGAAASFMPTPGRAIFVGTATGVLVWLVTRSLERMLFR